jgi:hypothetical protein
MQNVSVLKNFIKKYIGWEKFYKEFHLLESDIQFFTLYMKREAKSSFDFEVKISCGMSKKVFEALWTRMGRYSNEDTIETVFAQFCALKLMIKDLNSNERDRIVEDADIKEFVSYLEQYGDFTVSEYIGDFIDCSHSYNCVRKALAEIMGEEVKDEL